jgi:glycosyltransferase involved in cell wall biosynthesis
VYELVLTFYELTQRRNDLHLHIAGGPQAAYGDYFRALQHIVHELELQEKVTFYGRVNDAWNWYHGIDILVSNGYSEGLQVAPMEAMASGCYCLAHRWEGAEELLPPENLFYTDRQLQEKILAYCDSSEWEKQRQRDQMRAIVRERFDIEQTKQKIRQIVAEVSLTTAGGGRTQ